jgi:hypothetical protein
MTTATRRCFRCQGPLLLDGTCLVDGEQWTPPTAEPIEEEDSSPVGNIYSDTEKAFVFEHLHDMSYIDIAAVLGRTAKGIESLVRSMGWKKGYVRKGQPRYKRAVFAVGTPADSLLAAILRTKAKEPWAVSIAQLATLSGLSRAQVAASLRRLEERRYITRHRKRDDWWGHRPSTVTWVGPGIPYPNSGQGEGGEDGK